MRWHTRTAEETEAVGERLFAALPRSSTLFVIYLAGELGAGKTTLVRGFLRAGGEPGAVRSPTYTLMETYELPGRCVLHLDLYRLQEPAELEELGLREWASPGRVWLVEWPQRGAGRLPAPDLSVTLHADGGAHEIDVCAASALGEKGLQQIEEPITPA